MFPSIFTDELGLDITEALPIIKSWGIQHVDLRGRVYGKAAEALAPEQCQQVKVLLAHHGMTLGCIESSLGKVHLPEAARCRQEEAKLEGIIRLADATECRLVRSFFYWQPKGDLAGQLAVRPDEQQKVLDLFAPLAERARAAGLTLAFENCGVTPDEVLKMLDLLGVANWGMAWDCSNNWDCSERKKDEDAYLLRLIRRTKLLHVKAAGAVKGLGAFDIPYNKVLRVAAAAGIPGPVSAETHTPDPAASNIDMSRRTVEVIQAAWPSAAPGSLEDALKPKAAIDRPWKANPVTFVVVGLGMGHGRAQEITQTPGCKLMGVCDLVAQRAERTGRACGVPYTTDLQPWLDDPAVEVIYVVTETGRHAEVALKALAAGKHVLSTKPMEASLAACDEEVRLAEKKGLLLGIDFDLRFNAGTHELRNAVAEGRFGRLLSGNCALKVNRTMEYFRADGGWRGTRKWDGGGILSNQAVHSLDRIAFTIGIPAKVRCNIWTQNHDIEAEDLGTAVWLYDNGLVITYYATTNYPHPTWYEHFELEGTAGAYSLSSGGPYDKPLIRWYIDGAWSDKAPVPGRLEFINATDNFAAAVRGKGKLLCPGNDGRQSQAILDAMYRSAYDANGNWVEVSYE